MTTRLLPIDPVLFGDPLPAGHPWSAKQARSGWEAMGTVRAHVLDQSSRCTRCKRGVGSCGMRVTASWKRATCARCIRRVVVDGGAGDEVRERARLLWNGLDPANGRRRVGLRDERCRLWRAIAFWRCCGATATTGPGWLSGFFASDAALIEARP